jgi:hypothetical protein
MAPTTGIYSRLTGFRKVSQVLPVWGSTLCKTQPAQWASLLGFAKSPIGQSASDRDTESPRNPPRFLRIESKNNEGHALQFTSKGRRFHKEPAPRRNGSCMAQSSRSIARHGRLQRRRYSDLREFPKEGKRDSEAKIFFFPEMEGAWSGPPSRPVQACARAVQNSGETPWESCALHPGTDG